MMGENTDSGGPTGVLTNRRRQLVLSQLQDHESMALRDLAEQIAVNDLQTDIESLSEEVIDEVEIALHHVHTPKLAEAGYVEYDSHSQVVSLTETGRQASIETQCDRVDSTSASRVSVDLCPETVDLLHDLIRRDDRFGARMDYDEVIATVLADAGPDVGRESEEEAK
ncbi:DUF7344 domain-containing protein [Salinigranum halophilum]|jgi:hypothetical protein|uniref:DUF7344 domain-containing protein n=1 Tax=Salinigranum halophilum TaxID=2565931 RepID=UPI0010A92582|nr:hypothetical protein [Salinigranum halophilum]